MPNWRHHKKIEPLIRTIENNEIAIAKELALELYNDVRDFSQSIDFVKNNNGELAVTNHKYATPEYVLEKKQKIREWVGGH